MAKTNPEIAFLIARVAHWLANGDGTYTKKKAAKELARIAREIDPNVLPSVLGSAADL